MVFSGVVTVGETPKHGGDYTADEPRNKDNLWETHEQDPILGASLRQR